MGENVDENQLMKFNKKAKTISLLHLPAQERENFKFKNRCPTQNSEKISIRRAGRTDLLLLHLHNRALNGVSKRF
jgi:hypothetical protein